MAAATPAAWDAVKGIDPDPFVQVALMRIYEHAPRLLDAAAYVTLALADGKSMETMMAERPATQP